MVPRTLRIPGRAAFIALMCLATAAGTLAAASPGASSLPAAAPRPDPVIVIDGDFRDWKRIRKLDPQGWQIAVAEGPSQELRTSPLPLGFELKPVLLAGDQFSAHLHGHEVVAGSSPPRGADLAKAFSPGQKIRALVMRQERGDRRIRLSVRRAERRDERRQIEDYRKSSSSAAGSFATLGDFFKPKTGN